MTLGQLILDFEPCSNPVKFGVDLRILYRKTRYIRREQVSRRVQQDSKFSGTTASSLILHQPIELLRVK